MNINNKQKLNSLHYKSSKHTSKYAYYFKHLNKNQLQFHSRNSIKNIKLNQTSKLNYSPFKQDKINYIQFKETNNKYKLKKIVSKQKVLKKINQSEILTPHKNMFTDKIIKILEYKKYKTKLSKNNNLNQIIQLKTYNSKKNFIKSSIFSLKGKNKLFSQDTFLKIDKKQFKIYAVFDGHGQFGLEISQFLRDNFYSVFKSYFDQYKKNIALLLTKSIKQTITKLTQSDINIEYSGSTANIILIYQFRIYCLNIGDSRTIIINQQFVHQLSNDHRPSQKQEMIRILKHGGQIKTNRGFRFYTKFSQSSLGISRSIGDSLSKNYGIIDDLQLSQLIINGNIYVVIGTDGLFEFMTNENVNIFNQIQEQIKKNKDFDENEKCRNIVNMARKKWLEKFQYSDDITCILLYIQF